ncbi:MAG: SsrA-binding protein SmpB [Planctomycetota bacterium]|jgi:SsrA-binding protein|nr:SsrA-binding protein SmpB [Planctomycetota bacterium]
MAKKTPEVKKNPEFRSIAKNRQAFHIYEVLDKLECGLALTGTEVKSLREGHVAFADSFAIVQDRELFLCNLNISEYKMGNRFNHLATRKRKLLAHHNEIRKFKTAVEQRGLTLVPLGMHWKHGLAKVEIGLVRGKQLHDKRDTIKKREQQRDAQRAMREYSKG